MASPFSKTPETFSAYVEADSGVSTAKTAEDQNQVLPHGGSAAASMPLGLSEVSQGVMVLGEEAGYGNEGMPLLETAEGPLTFSPAVQGDTLSPNFTEFQQTPGPIFSVGEMVSPKEEVKTPGSNGADKMVCLEHSPQDMKDAGYETTIKSLKKQLESSNEKNSMLQGIFELAKGEYETTIAKKNAEIEKLKTEKEEYRVRLSKVQQLNDKEREAYRAKIKHLTSKLKSKEEEINLIKEDFKTMEQKHHEEKAALQMEVNRIEVEFKAQEAEHTMVKAELKAEKAELKAEKADLKTEIAEHKLKISEMTNTEMVLQCELDKANKNTAVAERTIAEERQKKAENDTARMKEEFATMQEEKATMIEENRVMAERLDSFTSSRSDSTASSTSIRRPSDVGLNLRLDSQSSFTSSRSDSNASMDANGRRPSDVDRPALRLNSQCSIGSSQSNNSPSVRKTSDVGGLTQRLNSELSVTGSGSDSNAGTNAGVEEELKEKVCGVNGTTEH